MTAKVKSIMNYAWPVWLSVEGCPMHQVQFPSQGTGFGLDPQEDVQVAANPCFTLVDDSLSLSLKQT